MIIITMSHAHAHAPAHTWRHIKGKISRKFNNIKHLPVSFSSQPSKDSQTAKVKDREDCVTEFCLLVQNFEGLPKKILYQSYLQQDGNCVAIWEALIDHGWHPRNPSQKIYLTNKPDDHLTCKYFLGSATDHLIASKLRAQGSRSFCTTLCGDEYKLSYCSASGEICSMKLTTPIVPTNYLADLGLHNCLQHKHLRLSQRLPFLVNHQFLL